MIFAPMFRDTTSCDITGKVGVVPCTGDDAFAILTKNECVRAVLRTTIHRDNMLFLVVLIVTIGIGQSPDSRDIATAIDVGVKGAKRTEETLRTFEFNLQLFDTCWLLGYIDPIEATVLVAGDQAILGINCEANPRPLRFTRYFIDQINLEALGYAELLNWRGTEACRGYGAGQ